MRQPVGIIKELWRYPVKSMEGEVVPQAIVDPLGMVGDRCWSVRDKTLDENSTVRKLPKLLLCSARYEEEPVDGQVGSAIPAVTVTLPNGEKFSSNDADKDEHLTSFLRKPVSLNALQPKSNWRFYLLKQASGEVAMKKQFNVKEELPSFGSISLLKMLELAVFATPIGRFYDAYPLHILTTNSIDTLKGIEPEGDFQARRFRPNLYIESKNKENNFDEFDWVGGKLFIGKTIIKCESRTVRCLMPAKPQAGGLQKDSKVLRSVEKHTKRHLGINATVIKSGTIHAGDVVYWEPRSKYAVSSLLQPVTEKAKNSMAQASLKLIDRLAKR